MVKGSVEEAEEGLLLGSAVAEVLDLGNPSNSSTILSISGEK